MDMEVVKGEKWSTNIRPAVVLASDFWYGAFKSKVVFKWPDKTYVSN